MYYVDTNTNINIQSNLQKPTNLQLVLNVVLQVWSRSYCRLSGCCLSPVVSFATSARNDFEDADSDVHCHLLLFCQSKPPPAQVPTPHYLAVTAPS